MNYYASHYRSGEQIRAGDFVVWHGDSGRIRFVIGVDEPPFGATKNEELDYFKAEYLEGFMLEIKNAGGVFERESDEDLQFLCRA